MEDIVDPHAALDEVAHQRNELAERVRVPGWYVAVDVVALTVLFCVPGISHRLQSWPHGQLLVVTPIFLLTFMVFSQWPLVVRYITGARLPTNVRRAYPSARRPFRFLRTTYVLAVVFGLVTEELAPWAIWVGCSLVFAVLVVIAQLRLLAAVRHDIRTGQVTGA